MADPRFALLPKHASFYRCPVDSCEDDGGLFIVVIRGPDGRQKATWACASHLAMYVEAELNHLRLTPWPDVK